MDSRNRIEIRLRNCGPKSHPPNHLFSTQRAEKVEKSATEFRFRNLQENGSLPVLFLGKLVEYEAIFGCWRRDRIGGVDVKGEMEHMGDETHLWWGAWVIGRVHGWWVGYVDDRTHECDIFNNAWTKLSNK